MHPDPSNTKPRCALVVVTDPVSRQLCTEALDGAGFRVVEVVQSGSAAVARARGQRPDLILLGEQLRDVPAREAVKWLRANSESADTPIIILGSDSKYETAPAAKTTVLPRPFTVGRLRRALMEAVENDRKVKTGTRNG